MILLSQSKGDSLLLRTPTKSLIALLLALILSMTSLIAETALATPSCQDLLESIDHLERQRQSQLPFGYITKYNTPLVFVADPTLRQLEQLRKSYHDGPIPELVQKLARGTEENISLTMREAPSLVQWNSSRNTMFLANPAYRPIREFIAHHQLGSLHSVKDLPMGLTFLTWFIHPEIATAPAGSHIRDLEKTIPYKATILDLSPEDLPYLKDLKKMTLEHLKKTFGVTSADDIMMFFHLPVSPRYAALHLHVRVNQAFHGADLAKSYPLDLIIHYLESGRSVADLIIDRAQQNNGMLINDTNIEQLNISRIPVRQVPNPFYNPSFGQP